MYQDYFLIELIQYQRYEQLQNEIDGVTVRLEKMKASIQEISQSEQLNNLLREELEQPDMIANMQEKVSDIIEKRLNELTPQLVKEIIQEMIKKHLGWLVVWGGVFGGAIGLIAALTNNF